MLSNFLKLKSSFSKRFNSSIITSHSYDINVQYRKIYKKYKIKTFREDTEINVPLHKVLKILLVSASRYFSCTHLLLINIGSIRVIGNVIFLENYSSIQHLLE